MGKNAFRLHLPAAVICLLLAVSCSTGKETALPQGSPDITALATAPEGLSDNSLPDLSELLKASSAPPSDLERYVEGGYGYLVLPGQNYGPTDVSGDIGQFTPNYSAPGNTSFDKTSYGIFVFSNMTEYTGPARILTGWQTEPADWNDSYCAVANYQSSRWDWFPMESDGSVELSGWSNYIAPNGWVYVVILQLGTTACSLDWLVAGDPVLSGSYIYSDLNLDPAQNIAPRTVSFNALFGLFGSTINSYDWDFDGDGSYEVVGDTDATETHEFTTPGNFVCTVRANVSDGGEYISELPFTIVDPTNQPPVASLSGDFNLGDAPLKVILDASGSSDDDTLVKYEWDIDGDGEYEYNTAATPTLEYTFTRFGTSDVTVRVTDNDFATDTALFWVTLDSGWRTEVIDSTGSSFSDIALGVHGSGFDTRAMVAYINNQEQRLKFARAGTDLGTGWSEPVEPVGSTPWIVSLAGIMANASTDVPQISFTAEDVSGDLQLQFVAASQVNGSSWNAPVAVTTDTNFKYNFSLCPGFNGRPGIAAVYDGGDGPDSVRYYLASDVGGQSWEAPVSLGSLGFDAQISSLDLLHATGFPLICSSGSFEAGGSGIVMSAATSATGLSWDAPDALAFEFSLKPQLAMISGRPALACGWNGNNASIYYLRADDSEGRSWSASPQVVAGDGAGGNPSLAMIDGVPAIAWRGSEPDGVMYVTAADANGSGWNEALAVETVIEPYFDVELIDSNGFPVIVYTDNVTGNLIASVWF